MDDATNSNFEASTARAGHPTVAGALAETLGEIRWNHPKLRVCCGVFGEGDRLCFLEVSNPQTLRPISEALIEGDAVREYKSVVEAARDWIFCTDVDIDPRMRSIPRQIRGEDTKATHVIALRSAGETIGFVRLDAASAGDIDASAVEALDAMVPTALVAASLEFVSASARETEAKLDRLTEWVSKRAIRNREAALQLRSALTRLTTETRRIAPHVGGDLLRLVDFTLTESTERIANLLESITDDSAPVAGFRATRADTVGETPQVCAPSTAGTP